MDAFSYHLTRVLADLEVALFQIAEERGGPELRTRLEGMQDPPQAMKVLDGLYPGSAEAVMTRLEAVSAKRRRQEMLDLVPPCRFIRWWRGRR